MKKAIAISSLLLGVVFLAGCGQQKISQIQTTTSPTANPPSSIQKTKPFDCGNDQSCLMQYAKKCMPAKGIIFDCQDNNIPCNKNTSNNIISEIAHFIDGGTTDNCAYRAEILYMTSPNSNSLLPLPRGLKMNCDLTTDELSRIFSTGLNDVITKKCSGSYIDFINQQNNPVYTPANISEKIDIETCLIKNGRSTKVREDGTACTVNQVDLGTIIKIDGKAITQCCSIAGNK